MAHPERGLVTGSRYLINSIKKTRFENKHEVKLFEDF